MFLNRIPVLEWTLCSKSQEVSFFSTLFPLKISINGSIIFRLFCETVVVSHVFFWNFAREIDARPAGIDPIAQIGQNTDLVPIIQEKIWKPPSGKFCEMKVTCSMLAYYNNKDLATATWFILLRRLQSKCF